LLYWREWPALTLRMFGTGKGMARSIFDVMLTHTTVDPSWKYKAPPPLFPSRYYYTRLFMELTPEPPIHHRPAAGS
jgi:hypothetical protein